MDIKVYQKRYIFGTFMEVYEHQEEYGIEEGQFITEFTSYILEELQEIFPNTKWTEEMVTHEIEQIMNLLTK